MFALPGLSRLLSYSARCTLFPAQRVIAGSIICAANKCLSSPLSRWSRLPWGIPIAVGMVGCTRITAVRTSFIRRMIRSSANGVKAKDYENQLENFNPIHRGCCRDFLDGGFGTYSLL